ncbi:unnamed protein product, partial [Symbiodinium sp. CCMP2456]
ALLRWSCYTHAAHARAAAMQTGARGDAASLGSPSQGSALAVQAAPAGRVGASTWHRGPHWGLHLRDYRGSGYGLLRRGLGCQMQQGVLPGGRSEGDDLPFLRRFPAGRIRDRPAER